MPDDTVYTINKGISINSELLYGTDSVTENCRFNMPWGREQATTGDNRQQATKGDNRQQATTANRPQLISDDT
jgi:hypothetical protein